MNIIQLTYFYKMCARPSISAYKKTIYFFVLLSTFFWIGACDQSGENKSHISTAVKIKIDSIPKFPKGYSWKEAEGYRKGFKRAAFMQSASGYYCTRISEFFPVSTIYRAGNVSVLGSDINPELGDFRAQTEFGEVSLDKYMELGNCTGYLVIKHGQIVYENYHHARDLDKHFWQENSKILISAGIGILEAEGKIDVANSVSSYIPELAGTDWADIPVIDLLDMASGIHCLDRDTLKIKGRKSEAFCFQESLGFSTPPSGTKGIPDVKSFLKTLKKGRASGQKYEHKSADAQVLGWIIESVTGLTYADFITDRFWSRMGAEGDAGIILSPSGVPVFGTGMNSNLRDMGRFALLFTPAWYTITKSQILPQSYIEKIQKGGRNVIYVNGREGEEYIREFAGNAPVFNSRLFDLVWDDGDFCIPGFGNQGIYISPKKDFVIVYQGILPDYSKYDLLHFTRALAKSKLLSGN